MTARPLVPTTRVVRRFPQRENLVLRARDTVCTETRVINTEVQFYFSHETLGNMPACAAWPCCFSRDAASHSRRVFRLRMPDCLITLVDQCADSEG